MKAFVFSLAAAAPLLLGACSSEQEPAPKTRAERSPATMGQRTLVAAGLSAQSLGPKIVGPQGPEVSSEISFEGQPVARMVSYVACPAPAEGEAAAEECVPADMPASTIYTYVHRITSTGADTEAQPFAFRTTRPASGFAKVIGYDRLQAESTLGHDYTIGVAEDAGLLIWRIEAGNGWDKGEELTFFWQSTIPPAGPAEAFEVQSNSGTADLTGPFPAPEKPAEEAGTGSASG
ncbi:MAG: hypothetical protein P1U62_07845 [Alteraurantiacibacter sp. bin_em_oilr2.035]|nr:hypothetical protein [Alteraurantiacibacter sp. bin_em_oilr2.035]